MKKFIIWAIVIVVVLYGIGAVISNVSLDDDDHEHSFVVQSVTDPTCETRGYTTYICSSCGYSENDYVELALGHKYVDGKCERCNKIDPYYTPPAHEHTFVNGKCECGESDPNYTPDTPPTHEHTFVNGKCECGESDPNYTPDNPPTHEHTFVNGKCECGESDPNYTPPAVETTYSNLTFVDATSDEHTNPARYAEGTELTLLDAERRGYTFLGWYNSANEKIGVISASETGDITLTAKWELTTYTITYENTKTADTSSYTKTYTMLDADIPLPTITLDGYTFGGWEIDGQRITYIKSGTVGNIVLKAILTPPQYTLLLETAYGKLESKTVTVGYGEHYTLPVLSYEGKTFLGWYDNTGESGVRYTDSKGNSLAPYSHTSGRMLYARFEALSCIVSYDTMGGDALKSTYADYGAAFNDGVVPTKENAIFAGWYNADFTSRYTSGSIISADITVYAKWIESTPISTADDLIAIKDNPSGNYYLTGDINMNGAVWSPIENFKGTLDGKGYKIKNFAIHISSFSSPFGFICINNGTIQNLIFADFTYSISVSEHQSNSYFGILVGANNKNIYNCTLESGAISVTDALGKGNYSSALGGICGKNDGNVVDCHNFVNINFTLSHITDVFNNQDDTNAYGLLGAIVGENSGRISSCSTTSTLTFSAYGYNGAWQENDDFGEIGGIAGVNRESGSISYCYSIISISASTSKSSDYNKWEYLIDEILYLGGLAGNNYGKITDSYSNGSIFGTSATTIDIGGAAGQNSSIGIISNCYSKVSVTSTVGGSVGGFVGYNNATIQNCYATGTVNSVGNTGGFVGGTGTGSTISKSYSAGNVTSTSSSSGYFIGSNSGILYNCYFMKGATLLVNGQYKVYDVEKDVVEGKSYSTIWSKEFLVNLLYWDSEGWIILANEDPILEWEISIDHSYEKIIIEPTCTDFGYTIYRCTDCDRYFIMDVVAEHGHEITQVNTFAPTCTERGYTASYCSRCDEVIASDIVEAVGHTHGALIEHRDPTCTEDGYNVYSCSVCSLYRAINEPIAATGHTEVIVPAVEQTCTEPGKTERIYCGVCKTLIKASKTIDPHFYHVEETKKATCTEAGECTKYCVVCEHTVEGAAIAPTGHIDLNENIICDECGVICGEHADDEFIEISNAEQLAAIADNLNGVYRLTANIALPSDWKPIGTEQKPFTGFLDGNGYVVTLCAFDNATIGGLFGYNDGTIVNVDIAGIYFSVNNANAIFGGITAYNSGVISNCMAIGGASLLVNASNSGASEALNRVARSVVFGSIVGENTPGGRIVCCTDNTTMLVKVTNTAKTTATNSLIGWLTGSFNDIVVESIVTVTVGGIVGVNGGEVNNCSAQGVIQIGEKGGSPLPTANAEHIYGTAVAENHYYVGYVAGLNNGVINNCSMELTIEVNVDSSGIYSISSFLTYKEKARSCFYLTA